MISHNLNGIHVMQTYSLATPADPPDVLNRAYLGMAGQKLESFAR